jgi:hypothetical protein
VHEVKIAERLAKSTMIKIVFLIVNFFKKIKFPRPENSGLGRFRGTDGKT